jgi:hypothetical protein
MIAVPLRDAGKGNLIRGVDVSEHRTAVKKHPFADGEIKTVEQKKQLENPDARVALEYEARILNSIHC